MALDVKNFLQFKNNDKKNKTSYSFLLVSLISPFLVTDLRFAYNEFIPERKLMLKQSYMLLTWFYYLTFLNKIPLDKRALRFFVLPTRRSTYTLTKAPMAHKNWSKEQYCFKFFLIRISFSNYFKDESGVIGVNCALLFVLLSKQQFPIYETNLLFLKTYRFSFYFSDKKYFSYWRYLV